MSAIFETNLTDYKGTLTAKTYEEGPGPIFTPTNVIRSNQNWGVEVEWDITGPLTVWLDAEFHVSVFLESMGAGPEYNLAPVIVKTLDAPLGANAAGVPERIYKKRVEIPAHHVNNGIYKVVVCVQLYERDSGHPTPFTAFTGSGMVHIYDAS